MNSTSRSSITPLNNSQQGKSTKNNTTEKNNNKPTYNELKSQMAKQVNKNDEEACPFFSLALAGNAAHLNTYLTAHLIDPEEMLVYKHTNIVKLPGVDLFAPLRLIDEQTGSTMLHFAAMTNVETVDVLIRFGMLPFINARNSLGCTPIFLASGRGNLPVVKYFVEHGASITITSKTGSSILHAACLSGNVELVEYLLSLPKLPINIDDDEFLTPLGVMITSISELKKQTNEMKTLLEETVLTITKDTSTFVMEENERIDKKREELGLNTSENEPLPVDVDLPISKKMQKKQKTQKKQNSKIALQDNVDIDHSDDDDNDNNNSVQPDYDTTYIGFDEQSDLIRQMINENEELSKLSSALEEGSVLLQKYLTIAHLLINPPVFKLTLPHVEHEIPPIIEEEEEEEDVIPQSEIVDTEIINTKIDDNIITDEINNIEDSVQITNLSDEHVETVVSSETTTTTTVVPTTTSIIPNVVSDTISINSNNSKQTNASMPGLAQVVHSGGKIIYHAAERSKIVHYPPYISYWMMIVETAEYDLIEACLNCGSVDINCTFPIGNNIRNATALHYAIHLGDLKLIQLLLKHGADPSSEMVIVFDSNSTDPFSNTEQQQQASSSLSSSLSSTSNSKPIVQKPQPKTITTKTGEIVQNRGYMSDKSFELLISMVATIKHQSQLLIDKKTSISTATSTTTTTTTAIPEEQNDNETAVTDTTTTATTTAATTDVGKKHDYINLPKQQGFSTLLAALFNEQEEIALYLLTTTRTKCFGKTYLATHELEPNRSLLTADILESFQESKSLHLDYHKYLSFPSQYVDTPIPIDNSQIDENSKPLTTFSPCQYGPVRSFYELLHILFPFLRVPPSEYSDVYPQIKKSPATKDGDMNYNMLRDGYSSLMTPDPLRLAITRGYTDIIHELLTLGADINAPYYTSSLTLQQIRPNIYHPVTNEEKEQYEALLKEEQTKKDEEFFSQNGIQNIPNKFEDCTFLALIDFTDLVNSPLSNAIKHKQTSIIRQLLHAGAKLDFTLATFFQQYGIDITSPFSLPLFTSGFSTDLSSSISKQGKQPSLLATQRVCIQFINIVPIISPLINAVQYHPDIMHMLLSHCPYIINQVSSQGRLPLHYAAELNKSIAALFLLSNNSLMCLRDQQGMTPLSIAASHDHIDVVRVLLSWLKRYRLCIYYHPQRTTPVNSEIYSLDNDDIMQIYNRADKRLRYFNTVEEQLLHARGDNANNTTTNSLQNIHEMYVAPHWIDIISDETSFTFDPTGFDTQSYLSWQEYMLHLSQKNKKTKKLNNESNGPAPLPGLLKFMYPPQPPPPTFLTYHPESSISLTSQQQLQSQPFRWFGFDISCANILSLYYTMVNTAPLSKDCTTFEPWIEHMKPLINKIDGSYGHIIRAYRVSVLTGSVLTLRSLHDMMVSFPHVNSITIPGIPTPVALKEQALWVELIVPSDEQLKTVLMTCHGYRLLENNIVVDPHGFIVRNVTYEYACEMYKVTTGRGKINPTRLCLPLRAYLATEVLGSACQNGYTIMVMELLTKQGLPLLQGLSGKTFIRGFHQYYLCNPLARDKKSGEFNLSGVIKLRIPSLPFSTFMHDDISLVSIPVTPENNHFLVNKSSSNAAANVLRPQPPSKQQVQLEKEKQQPKVQSKKNSGKLAAQQAARQAQQAAQEKKAAAAALAEKYSSLKNSQATKDTQTKIKTKEDATKKMPDLVDIFQPTAYKDINIYKVSTYSPLHVAVLNDYVPLVRVLLGLETLPNQDLSTEDEQKSGHDDNDDDDDEGDDVDNVDDNNFSSDNDNITHLDGDIEHALPQDVEDIRQKLIEIESDSNHHLNDIALKTNTLQEIVKVLNLEGFAHDDDDNDNDNNVGASNISINHTPKQQLDIDMTPLKDQSILDAQNDTAKHTAVSKETKIIKSPKAQQLPPLLHIPQPADPTFQLINRLVRLPITANTKDNTIDKAVNSEQVKDNSITESEHITNVFEDMKQNGEDKLSISEKENDDDKQVQKEKETQKPTHAIFHVLHLCAMHDFCDMAELLIQYGAIIDIKDHEGNTPLHISVRDCSRLTTETLLSYYADVNAQNNNGDTPIHVALQYGYLPLAQVMIDDYRGDVTIVNNQGISVQDLLNKQLSKENEETSDETLGFDIPSVDGLVSKTSLPSSAMDLQKLTPEEKRRHNRSQLLLLRNELQRVRELPE